MTKNCAICGNEFETGRGSKKYCSDGCRYRATLAMSRAANRKRRQKSRKADGFNDADRLAKEMGISYQGEDRCGFR